MFSVGTLPHNNHTSITRCLVGHCQCEKQTTTHQVKQCKNRAHQCFHEPGLKREISKRLPPQWWKCWLTLTVTLTVRGLWYGRDLLRCPTRWSKKMGRGSLHDCHRPVEGPRTYMIYRFYRLRPAIKELSLWWSVKPKDLDTSTPLAAQINFPFETLAPPCRKYHPWGRRCPKETSLSYVTLALALALYVQWLEGDHTRSRNAREGCWNHQWNQWHRELPQKRAPQLIKSVLPRCICYSGNPMFFKPCSCRSVDQLPNNFKRP